MTMFDGKNFANTIEKRIKARVAVMEKKPKIVSVLVGSDPASELYTKLKKQKAERVGIEFEIVRLDEGMSKKDLQERIREIGERGEGSGVMVQMPIPGITREEQEEILEAIPLAKDVDGLRWEESGVMPATVRAIMMILQNIADHKIQNSKSQISNNIQIQNKNNKTGKNFWRQKFVVVGARGSVGRPLVHYLRERGVRGVAEVEWDSEEPARMVLAGEVVISCVGKMGIVSAEMIADGATVIDVGSPVGDITKEAYEKASVSVEVPGGVGPVTVVSLMESSLERI